MIAITFALPVESSGVIRRVREKRRAARAGEEIIYGKIDNKSVAIFRTGVGQKICQKKIDNFLKAVRPDFLLSAGFAGGVREDLQVGDLIVAENFSDWQLLSRAEQILADRKARTVKLFTSTTIVDSIAERNEIARVNDAAAVDMETETIAAACAAHGIRLLSLRVISDSLRKPLPAPPSVLFDIERQQTNFAKLIPYLLRRPAAIWRLIRFARQVRKARNVLTNAIIAVASEL